MSPRILLGGPGVQQCYAAVPGQAAHVFDTELLHNALGEVFNEEARHVHGVLGGGVGRRVGQVQVLQPDGRQPGVNGRGQYVDSLVHALITHDLGPQEAEGLLFKDHLHGHQLPAGIVARVAHGREDHRVRV